MIKSKQSLSLIDRKKLPSVPFLLILYTGVKWVLYKLYWLIIVHIYSGAFTLSSAFRPLSVTYKRINFLKMAECLTIIKVPKSSFKVGSFISSPGICSILGEGGRTIGGCDKYLEVGLWYLVRISLISGNWGLIIKKLTSSENALARTKAAN